MKKIINNMTLVMLLLVLSQAVYAETTLLSLQQRWAEANYTLTGDVQEKAFQTLIEDVELYTNDSPEDAQRWIWSGIIKSTFAGTVGGLGALSFAKAAKKDLDRALNIDEKALDGSAHTSIATLYYQVPGWPIGFGSDKKALKHFKKALQFNPEGIDSNYFYGEFLFEEKKNYADAEKYLIKARNATPRENRQLADKERQKEISALLLKVQNKLKK